MKTNTWKRIVSCVLSLVMIVNLTVITDMTVLAETGSSTVSGETSSIPEGNAVDSVVKENTAITTPETILTDEAESSVVPQNTETEGNTEETTTVSAEIPIDKMIATAGSTDGSEAPNAIDGNTGTYWHSDWQNDKASHENHWLKLTLKDVYLVDGFKYLPRQDDPNAYDNRIETYKILTSMDDHADDADWNVAAEGTWENDLNWKVVEFETPVNARYIKLVTVNSYKNPNDPNGCYAAAAEVKITGKIADAAIPTSEIEEIVAGSAQTGNGTSYYEGTVEYLMDGKPGTWWHSSWSNDTGDYSKHYVTFKLKEEQMVNALHYLPRHDSGTGMVTRFAIQYKLNEADDWADVVYTSSTEWAADTSWKEVTFEPVKAKYIKFQSLEGTSSNANKYSSAAEIRLGKCTHAETSVYDVKEATCGADGYTGDKKCVACGYMLETGEVVSATGDHQWGEPVVVESTTDKSGTETSECTVCQETKVEKLALKTDAMSVSSDFTLQSGIRNEIESDVLNKEYVFDRDPESYWMSQKLDVNNSNEIINSQNRWLEVDLGGLYTLDQIEYTPRRYDNTWNAWGNLRNLIVEVSIDKVTWKSVTPEGGANLRELLDAGRSEDFPYAVAASNQVARYIRISGTESYGGGTEDNKCITVGDLAIYGEKLAENHIVLKVPNGEAYKIVEGVSADTVVQSLNGAVAGAALVEICEVEFYNHKTEYTDASSAETVEVSNYFEAEPNSEITLDDLKFKFTHPESDTENWYIQNVKNPELYLTNDADGNFFGSEAKIMKAEYKNGAGFEMCQKDGENFTRYTVFWMKNMTFNANGAREDVCSCYEHGFYELRLFAEKDTVASSDVIPGYEEVTAIENEGEYIIGFIYEDDVFVVYPEGGPNPQTKRLVKETHFEAHITPVSLGETSVIVGDKLYNVEVTCGHVLTPHEAKAPTCTTHGVEAYWVCSACNKYFRDEAAATEIPGPQAISPTGHTFTEIETKDANVHTVTCSGCEANIDETHLWEDGACKKCNYQQEMKHSVTVYIDGVQAGVSETVLHGSFYTAKAETVAGKEFSYWAYSSEGARVSTSSSYTFYVTQDMAIYAVYVDSDPVEKQPTITMSHTYTLTTSGKNYVCFEAMRDVPEGYEVVEHGILYGLSKSTFMIKDAEGNYILDTVANTADKLKFDDEEGTVLKKNVKKYKANTPGGLGAFTLKVSVGNNKDNYVHARGYVVVEDASGNRSVIYSDVVSKTFNNAD